MQLNDVQQHELSNEQRSQLNDLIKTFRSFEKHGLRRTTLETHKIELIEGATSVKDRHYPVSPAVQELIFNEIDQMLKLGVIEESESAWSSRSTLV